MGFKRVTVTNVEKFTKGSLSKECGWKGREGREVEGEDGAMETL